VSFEVAGAFCCACLVCVLSCVVHFSAPQQACIATRQDAAVGAICVGGAGGWQAWQPDAAVELVLLERQTASRQARMNMVCSVLCISASSGVAVPKCR
jgi:hypothetical protein